MIRQRVVFVFIMEALFEHLKEIKDVQLPINKIDGILVNSRLYTTNGWGEPTMMFSLEIYVKNGCSYIDSGVTYEDFCRMIEGIKDMKFDTFNGVFTNPSRLLKTTPLLYELPMFHHPNVEMDYTDCCICMEMTITKTPCSHALCIRCQQKLKKSTCPLCRENISWNHVN